MISTHRKPRSARIGIAASAALFVVMVLGPALPAAAAPGDLTLVSTSDAGVKGDSASSFASIAPIASAGPWVAFVSDASNFDPADGDAISDIYVKNLGTGDVTLVSTSTAGVKGNANSLYPAISADGRYVAFESVANNLDPADMDGNSDIYLKDLETGELTLVSTSSASVAGNGESFFPSIVADEGVKVAFQSSATNLDPADGDAAFDVYVKDLATFELTLASTSDAGEKGDGDSFLWPNALTAAPLRVAFSSGAANLDPNDGDTTFDVYVKNLESGDLTLASTSIDGDKGNATSADAAISGDLVAFTSGATNLHPNDGDPRADVFVKNLASGFVWHASSADDGTNGNESSARASIAGGMVAFVSSATNLDPADTDLTFDVYAKDLGTMDLSLVSTSSAGVKGNDTSDAPVVGAGLVAFHSWATTLDTADTDPSADVYVKEPPSPTNNAPVATDDAYSTNENVDLSVPAPGVMGNDVDADGDQLSASLVTLPANGTVTLGADGSFLYEPDAGFDGTDTFAYAVNDGAHASTPASVTITVVPAPLCSGVCLSIDDVSVAEDDRGTTKAVFTIFLSAPSQNQVAVLVETIAQTATPGSDYAPFSSRIVTIRVGRTTATTTVNVKGDRALEPDETYVVQLSSPVNAGISDGQGIGTIVNDD